MVSDFKSHKIAYITLVISLFLFVLMFLQVWPNRTYQRLLIIGLCLFYFIWGVVVHVKDRHINKKIILEYSAVSLLAGLILTLLTFKV